MSRKKSIHLPHPLSRQYRPVKDIYLVLVAPGATEKAVWLFQ